MREAVCILVQRRQWEQEYYRTVALAAAAAGGENIKQLNSALASFQTSMFPYLFRAKEDVEKTMRRMLDRAFAQGPIRITRKTDDSR